MAIGANWQEIWGPVWKAVWTQTPAEPVVVETTRTAPGRKQYVQIGNKRVQVRSRKEAEDLLERYVEKRTPPKQWKAVIPPPPEDDDEDELLLILMALH